MKKSVFFFFVFIFTVGTSPLWAFNLGKAFSIVQGSIGIIKSISPMGKDEEKTIGEATSIRLISDYGGVINNRALNRYVNLVGNAVLIHTDSPNSHFCFAVLDSDGLNAFAAPGGFIFITRGILALVNNEAELAAVLAHEIAHVQKEHMISTLKRSRFLNGVKDVSLAFMKKNPAKFDQMINFSTDILLTRGLDKGLEYEADLEGLEYAYRAGYNPSGIVDFLKKLDKVHGSKQSIFFSTHPSTRTRIEKLENVLELKYADGKSLPYLEKRYHKNIVRK